MYRRHPYIAAVSLGALLGVGVMLAIVFVFNPLP